MSTIVTCSKTSHPETSSRCSWSYNPVKSSSRLSRIPYRHFPVWILSLLCACSLAACGAGRVTGSVRTRPGVPNNSQPPSAVGSSAVANAGGDARLGTALHGIVILSCSENSADLTSYDPASGEQTDSVSFVIPSGWSAACGETGETTPDSPLLARSQFTSDYSRMTLFSTQASDNSEHVGYIAAGSATATDITPPGDTFEGVPHDTQPTYDVTDDQLYFNDHGSPSLATIGPNGTVGHAGEAPRFDKPFYVFRGGMFDQNYVSNPAGTQGVGHVGPCSTQYYVLLEPANRPDTQENPTHCVSVGADECGPIDWFASEKILCWTEHQETIAGYGLLTLSRGARPASLTELLPPTDQALSGGWVPPDATQFAFIGSRGNTITLYVSDLSGGRHSPRAVTTSLPMKPLVLDWLP